MRLLACAAILSVGAPAALADSGIDLLRQCRPINSQSGPNVGERVNAAYCFGYLRGLVEGNIAIPQWLADDEKAKGMFCVPPEGQNEQIARVVIQYLEAHPQDLHQSAVALSLAALYRAFPCPK